MVRLRLLVIRDFLAVVGTAGLVDLPDIRVFQDSLDTQDIPVSRVLVVSQVLE